MKLTVFQSDKGDCLLLTDVEGHNIFIDGGMRSSYQEYVRPLLGEIGERDEKLDLVYVSHIDQDHISGVLQMLEDEVAWRVYNYHHSAHLGNPNWREPDFKRPPEVGAIWHNAFHDQIPENQGLIEDMLAASAGFLFSAGITKFESLAQHYMDLVTSIGEAIQVSRRISAKQLNIPLNPHFDGKLALVRDDQSPISLGEMRIFVIGPFRSDLEKLREEWNAWVEKNSETVRKLRRQAREAERLLSQAGLEKLADIGLIAAGGLGDRDKVTPANLASLMLLAEAEGKTILLTGDGHANDILKGLKHYGKLNANGGIHVNVLKVQHHGSEHNTNEEFAKLVTADHYVFCGNGAHSNPDLKVVDLFVLSRIGNTSQRSQNPEVSSPFQFWFNSTSTMPGAKPEDAKHMEKLERRMKTHSQNSNGKLRYTFFQSAKVDIDI